MNSLHHAPHRLLMTADTVGGVWTYALELAGALQAHGVEIALATMGRPLTRKQRQEAHRLANVEVFESAYKLEWMEEPWRDVAAAGEWLLGLEAQAKPELAQLNGYVHGALPWQVPKLVVGHSCVLSWWQAVHGTQAPGQWKTYRQAVAAGLGAADLVIAPSQAMLRALHRHYGPLPKTRVIANGRKLLSLRPQPKEKLVLCAGRLWDAAKNVRALTGIASVLPWPVYLAGETQAAGDADGRHEPVHYLGRLSAAELLPWFARASIYALPARYEPFGLSALEAGLAGCALVLGDIPSLREIWGDAALFVPPEEPAAWQEALKELMASPVWLAALATKARLAAARYTPEKMALAYLEAYAEVMERHRHEHSPSNGSHPGPDVGHPRRASATRGRELAA